VTLEAELVTLQSDMTSNAAAIAETEAVLERRYAQRVRVNGLIAHRQGLIDSAATFRDDLIGQLNAAQVECGGPVASCNADVLLKLERDIEDQRSEISRVTGSITRAEIRIERAIRDKARVQTDLAAATDPDLIAGYEAEIISLDVRIGTNEIEIETAQARLPGLQSGLTMVETEYADMQADVPLAL